jgi:hypothetical protein
VSTIVLKGPFLDRATAAHRSGIDPQELRLRPDVLRIGGRSLPEVYFAFQFDDEGLRPDLAAIVRRLRAEFEDEEIADYLARRVVGQ